MGSAMPFLEEVRAIVAEAEREGRELTLRECEQCDALLEYVKAWQRLARVARDERQWA